MGKISKIFLILIITLLCAFPAFAKEGDVHVFRDNASTFSFDIGGGLDLASDEEKEINCFMSFTLTPITWKNISGGVKAEFTLSGLKNILTSGGGIMDRLWYSKMSAACIGVGKYCMAKSFEFYGGLGLQYSMYEIEELDEFSQAWGLLIQGGGRGRLNDWFGVGVEMNFFKPFTKDTTNIQGMDLRAYLSFEV